MNEKTNDFSSWFIGLLKSDKEFCDRFDSYLSKAIEDLELKDKNTKEFINE